MVTLVSMSTFSMTVSIIPDPAGASTVFVGGTGPGNFSVIQSAMDNANPGDTVFVYSGIYYEQPIFRKPLNLVGEDRDTTIINGSMMGDVVNITVEYASISGFTVKSGRFSLRSSCIELYFANHTTISNTRIMHCYDGIAGWFSNFTTIENTIIRDTSDGIIFKYSHNSTFTGNDASYNDLGIYIGMFSRDNALIGNNASFNYEGFQISFSDRSEIRDNVAYSNLQNCYYFTGTHDNVITGNVAAGCFKGMYLGFANDNYIANNKVNWNSEGMTILGTNGTHFFQNNVSANYGNNIAITDSFDNKFESNVASHSLMGKGVYMTYSVNNWFLLNDFSHNPYDGISISTSDNNTFTSNIASWNGNSGAHSYYSRNNTFRSNSFSYNKVGIYLDRSPYSKVTQHQMSMNGIYMMGYLVDDWNTHVIDGTNSVNGRPVLYWKNMTGGTVPVGVGEVILANCTNVVVQNHVISNSSVGILMGFSDFNTIRWNDISYESFEGISAVYSINNTISNNALTHNQKGLYTYAARESRFNDNIVRRNVEGIIAYMSMYNTFSKNKVSSNDYGIRIWSSSYNVVRDNNVSWNYNGIYCLGGTYNRIFHNNISYNDVQAYDSWMNQWDDGYPSGGNWWSDYTGIDNRTGPNQDIPGRDGIGDTPYDVGFYSMDRYPLNPIPPPPPPMNLRTRVVNVNDIALTWVAPVSPYVNYYLIYRSTDQREFNFFDPIHNTSDDMDPLATSWIDENAASPSAPREYYYVVRAVYKPGAESVTSNTAGKWTKHFSAGINTFALPFEIFFTRTVSWYVSTIDDATFMRWMDPSGHWVTHINGMGPGINDAVVENGVGYEIYFRAPVTYTFCGQPASQIRFQDWIGDSVDFRKSLTAQQVGNDIRLTWDALPAASEFRILRSEKRDGLHEWNIQPVAAVPSAENTWTDVGVLSTEKEIYYMIMPMDSRGNYGSSTFSVGVITLDFAYPQTTFAVPLETSVTHTVDWYCDQIPSTAGIAFMISGLWKFHATEMPMGVYDPLVVQAEGYQMSFDGSPTDFAFVGY
jgi:parallel beta-helix repeat protein